MKNISTLVTRLAALSLAVSLVFSVAQADAPRKGGPAALISAAMASGGATKQLTSAGALVTTSAGSDKTDKNFVVGTNCAGGGRNLTVWGNGRFDNDVVVGKIATDKKDSGNKYIIGCVDMNPHTQTFSVVFNSPSPTKPDTTPAIGSFEFVTTGTFYKGSTVIAADLGLAGVSAVASGVSFSPWMSGQQIMNSNHFIGRGVGALDFRSSATSVIFNAPNTIANPTYDLRLTFTAMPSIISKEVRFGVIPYNVSSYPKFSGATISASGTGYWDGNWVNSNGALRPLWGCSWTDAFSGNELTKTSGLLSYRIVGNNISGVGLASTDITAVAATTIDSLVDSLSDSDKLSILAHIIGNLPSASLDDVQTILTDQGQNDADAACTTRDILGDLFKRNPSLMQSLISQNK